MNSIINSKKYNFIEFFLENQTYFLMLFTSILFAVFYKKLFFISLFISLDLLNSLVNSKYRLSLPMDFLLAGVIIFSMKYEFYSGMIFIPFIIFNKLIMGKLEFSHFLKVPTLILVSFMSSLLITIPLNLSIFIILLIRYLFEYFIAFFIFGEFNLKKIPRRLYNFLGMYTFFVVFGNLLIKII